MPLCVEPRKVPRPLPAGPMALERGSWLQNPSGQAFPPLSLLRVSRCAASWSGGLPDPVSRPGWLLNSHP